MASEAPLRTAIIGCGPMAGWHADAMDRVDCIDLAAFMDIDEARARTLAEKHGDGATYTDVSALLAGESPDAVVIVTPTDSHAALTIQCAEAGVPGVVCEKPMATCMREGRAMVEACRAHGTALVVHHQRRMSPAVETMRDLIEAGAIGKVELFRGSCAGDLLSDATHLVDTIRFLTRDEPVVWVLGQVHREVGDPVARNPQGVQLASAGRRYGHAVETGAIGVWETESGYRAEALVGDMRLVERAYGDYEVFGSEGRLWRPGDKGEAALLIQDQSGGWRPVDVEPAGQQAQVFANTAAVYSRFAEVVRTGCDHPMGGDSGLADLEVIMAIGESARLRRKIGLPLEQEEYPLQLMIDDGVL